MIPHIFGSIGRLTTWLILALADQQHDYPNQDNNESIVDDDVTLPLFDLFTISAATNEFSLANKIGQGGFGTVYKVDPSHIYSTREANRFSLIYYCCNWTNCVPMISLASFFSLHREFYQPAQR